MFTKLFVKRKRLFFIIANLFIITLFWMNQKLRMDPDFGWHLRMGEIILKSGIPKTDPFSYTMPSYPSIDHEWLANVFFASFYPHLGIDGITLLFVLVAFLAVFLQTISVKKEWVLLPLLLCGAGILVYMIGIRVQVFSWLFCSLLFLLFLRENLWQKFRWGLSLLFLVWVNLHGSFALGLGLVLFVTVLKQIRAKNVLLADWIIFLTCLGATLLNPYGIRVWWEIFQSMSDTPLRWSIEEWFPTVSFFNAAFLLYVALSASLVLKFRKKFTLIELSLYVVLLIFGLSSSRHLPFWLLFALPITARVLEYFFLEVKKEPFGSRRFGVAYIVLFVVTAGICLFHLVRTVSLLQSPYYAMYPAKGVGYLKSHPSRGNLFSLYDWGGYLIWQLPEKKVFIDGRMPSWRWNGHIAKESDYAFSDYQKFLAGEIPFDQIIKKYHISTLLVTLESPSFEKQRSLVIWGNKTFGFPFADPNYIHAASLNAGWKEVYRDTNAVIYEDPSFEKNKK